MKDRNKGFFSGVIIGGIVAGVSALLFAPKSGKETREDIGKNVTKMRDDLGVHIEEFRKASVRFKGKSVKESKELLEKAEKLKNELGASALKVAGKGKELSGATAVEAKKLLDESKVVLDELQKTTGKVVKNASKEIKKSVNTAKKKTSQIAQESSNAKKPTASAKK